MANLFRSRAVTAANLWRVAGFACALCAPVSWAACWRPVAPSDPKAAGSFLVGGLESGRLLIVDGGQGTVTGSLGPHFRIEGYQALDSARSTLYKTGVLDDSTHRLLALDLVDRRVLWSERLSDNTGFRRIVAGLEVFGSTALAVSGKGDMAALTTGRLGALDGVAFFGLPGLSLVGRPLVMDVRPGGLAWFPPNARHPVGGWIIASRPPEQRIVGDVLYLVDGVESTLADTTVLPAGEPFYEFAVSPDGLSLIVGTRSRIMALSLTDWPRLRSVPRPANGTFVVADDGRIYVFDFGLAFDSPGSGYAHVLGQDLASEGRINLVFPPGAAPTPLGQGVVSKEGLIVVPTGTTRIGPLFGVSKTRLLLARAGTGAFSSVDLDDWGTGYAVALPTAR